MPGSGGGGTGGDGARTTTRQAGCQDWNQGGKGGYGSATEPWSFGSGGGNGAYDGNIETYYGGAGGGRIRIEANVMQTTILHMSKLKVGMDTGLHTPRVAAAVVAPSG
jgi:hypothetical protein